MKIYYRAASFDKSVFVDLTVKTERERERETDCHRFAKTRAKSSFCSSSVDDISPANRVDSLTISESCAELTELSPRILSEERYRRDPFGCFSFAA